MQLAKGIIAIISWHATRARSYKHEELATRCLSCGAEPYSEACAADNHARWRHVDTKVEDQAPDETRLVQHLYGQLVRAAKSASFACGEQVYHIAEGRGEAFTQALAKVRDACNLANASFKHAKADFDIKYLSIGADEETVRSLRRDVEGAVDKLLGAIASGDGSAIRKALRDTRNFAEVLSGMDRAQANELGAFASHIAGRLREAAREGQEVADEVTSEAKQGAARFAGIFGEILGTEEAVAEQRKEVTKCKFGKPHAQAVRANGSIYCVECLGELGVEVQQAVQS